LYYNIKERAMETLILKTNLHCSSCVEKIEPLLKGNNSIKNYSFDLEHPEKLVTIQSDKINFGSIISIFSTAGYKAEDYNQSQVFQIPELKTNKKYFWQNIYNWKRASFNTLNCLIGCSIGDFGMLIFLQAYYPETSMTLQMVLAIIAGLTTSVILETVILKRREKFDWTLAFKTALSMSFISMVGMEIAMNATDFMITGGKAAFNSTSYWFALIPAMIVGFLLPLPYNYYKLEKHGKACH
jgi:copper chaperone CopZ